MRSAVPEFDRVGVWHVTRPYAHGNAVFAVFLCPDRASELAAAGRGVAGSVVDHARFDDLRAGFQRTVRNIFLIAAEDNGTGTDQRIITGKGYDHFAGYFIK